MSNLQVVDPTRSLLVGESKSQIALVKGKVMQIMLPGGRKLNDMEATALACYSYMTGLNPFNGECYFLPGVGATDGVAGRRRKSQEWVDAHGGGTISVQYRKADIDEAAFDPDKGDVAYVAILRDDVARREWLKSLKEITEIMKGIGMNGNEAWQIAIQQIGGEPTWEAVGVVDHRESFSRDDKPDKWDRHERAKKRAEKAALKKRFPAVLVQEEQAMMNMNFVKISDELGTIEPMGEPVEIGEDVIDVEFDEVQALRDLGVEVDAPKTKSSPSKEADDPAWQEPKREAVSDAPMITPKFLVDNELSSNVPHASTIINGLGIAGKPATTENLALIGEYRKLQEQGLSDDEALAQAKQLKMAL